ncbi:MAG: hypothetical protein BWX64_00493 [Acidobacteria bacterium ADurb.Bin051]|nr:MAG: hypothetical protein BWX64_00493 [Acidobacteria bacterium ADurb.Bin051]
MRDLLMVLGFIVIWYLVQVVVLPRLGVPT